MIAAAGGSTIPCAPYATFGTKQLSEHVAVALKNRKATLLQHLVGVFDKGVPLRLLLLARLPVLSKRTHGWYACATAMPSNWLRYWQPSVRG